MTLRLRDATLDDVEAIVEVAVAAWEEGYRGIVSAEIDPREAWNAERVRFAMEERQGRRGRAVAELDGKVEGFIVFGASRDAGASRRVGEIWVLNVHPRSWRRGVGRALVEHALAALGTAGFGEVTLWTPARSPRARSFYEACGFRHDGAEQRRESFGNALEVRYRRVLGGRYSSALR